MANGGSQLSLEVLIKTIADSRGVKASEQDIKAYAKSLENAAQAGKALDTSADKIEQGLRDQAKASETAGEKQKESGKKIADSSKQAARGINELGEGYERGAAAGRVLTEVAGGNVMAIGQLGAAIKVIGTLLKTNMIGALLALGAVAAQILIPLIKGFTDAKKKIEETAVGFKVAEAEAKKLRDVKFDALQKELEAVNSEAQRTVALFTQVLQLQGKQDEAEAAAQIAAIEADASLTPLQKLEKTTAIRGRNVQRARVREDLQRQTEEGAAAGEYQRSERFALNREADRDAQRKRVDAIEQDRVDRAARIKALEKEKAQITKQMGTVQNAEQFAPLSARDTAIAAELKKLREREAFATSDVSKRAFEEQQRILDERTAAARAARDAATKSGESYAGVVGRNRVTDATLPQIRRAEDQARDLQFLQGRREAVQPVLGEIDAKKKEAEARAASAQTTISELEERQLRSLTLGGDPAIAREIAALRQTYTTAIADRDRADADFARQMTQKQVESNKAARRRNTEVLRAMSDRDRQQSNVRSLSSPTN